MRVAGATGTWLCGSSKALGQAMLNTLVFDASSNLGTSSRLQKFVLQRLQRCRLLQREGVGEEESGGGCGGGWAWRCCAIREKELSCASQTITTDFGTDLLVSALFVVSLRCCWLRR